MAITGNKGEWSEIYALFKLLGEKQVYAGDGNLNKIEDLFNRVKASINLACESWTSVNKD